MEWETRSDVDYGIPSGIAAMNTRPPFPAAGFSFVVRTKPRRWRSIGRPIVEGFMSIAPSPTHTTRAIDDRLPPNANTLIERILRSMNDAQRRAAECVDGPLLCLAGAGSGKTRVLTTRLALMIARHGIPASNLLAVTFTRKAAEEMHRRLAIVLGEEIASEITLGTFHAIGAKILRDYGGLISVNGRFTIADEADSAARVRRILQTYGIAKSHPAFRPSALATLLEKAKKLITTALSRRVSDPCVDQDENLAEAVGIYRLGIDQVFADLADTSDAVVSDPELLSRIYRDYQASLVTDNVVDYQDLVSLPVCLFLARPEVLRIYRQQWRRISVDEYQDTDEVQDEFLRLLALPDRHLCVVGDDDQAIYGWRGARVDNIRTFERRYAPCTVVMLEDNYRSTPNIVAVANAIIQGQHDRVYNKTLRSRLPEGPQVKLWSCLSQETEAEAIVQEILQLLYRGEIRSLDDVMVLYRVNALLTPLERAFRRARIPYRVIGGTRFIERKEVRDLLAYLNLAANPKDRTSFERVVNSPARGIGPATMEAVLQHCRATGLDPITACRQAGKIEHLRKNQARALEAFASIIDGIAHAAGTMNGLSALHETLRLSGYREHLIDRLARAEAEFDEEEIEDARTRLAVIDELVQWAETFAREFSIRFGRLPSVTDLIDSLIITSPTDEPHLVQTPMEWAHDAAPAQPQPAVNLMTIHAAKGLEAPAVFVVGLEEGVLPVGTLDASIIEPENLEEEGRLFYVAATRAMRYLYLSSARSRELHDGLPRPMAPSRFLARLPETGHVIQNQS